MRLDNGESIIHMDALTIIVAMLLMMVIGTLLLTCISLIHLAKMVPRIMEIYTNQTASTLKHNYSVQQSRELLEYLVKQKLTEWRIYNVDPSSDNYVTEERMKEAIEYIIKKIMLEMTPITKNILSVGYPMETEDDMIESIKNCAKLTVLYYSIQQNTIKERDETIPNINAF